MPIRIPDALPAADLLRQENVFVMPESQALHQDIRPLEVVLLNLMPQKIAAENQILRLLANTPLQVNVTLLRIDDQPSRHTCNAHLSRFYRDFSSIREHNVDGLIITGAPLGQLPFSEVRYWPQLQAVLDWARAHVTSSMFLCWAAQAALYYYHAVPRSSRQQKWSGIYAQQLHNSQHQLTRGFDDQFLVPLSRYGDFFEEAIGQVASLDILASHPESGVYMAASGDGREVYVSGHPEYDAMTLAEEYQRDCAAGLDPALPVHYFPGDDPGAAPRSRWRSHANLLFSNWLNYCVYQATPFDLSAPRPASIAPGSPLSR
ncbi:homoserine O-succinyltransferase [Gallaecimonas sp. GXIMD1310]|uniref:homoserine O-succinyltransferase n=1 Tax=Gallaecimonas sp. GXIMD1310 TaxID=3131926 RepID=UPI00324D40E8